MAGFLLAGHYPFAWIAVVAITVQIAVVWLLRHALINRRRTLRNYASEGFL
jgi:heme exporter protein D